MIISTENTAANSSASGYQERRLAAKYALYPYVALSLAIVSSFFISLWIGYQRVASNEKFSEYGVPFIPAPADAGAKPVEATKPK